MSKRTHLDEIEVAKGINRWLKRLPADRRAPVMELCKVMMGDHPEPAGRVVTQPTLPNINPEPQ